VYVSPWDCGALLLVPDEPIRAVALPRWSEADAYSDAGLFHAARIAALAAETAEERDAAQAELRRILDRLSTAVAPVLDAVPPGPAPRLWWCPVGILALLPLHAVGTDRVVPSYTVTVRMLEYARQPAPPGPAGLAALVVATPRTPNETPLPGVTTEAARVAALLPSGESLTGPAATNATVRAALPRHRVVHFACHALSA
jgi:hypothetical protein